MVINTPARQVLEALWRQREGSPWVLRSSASPKRPLCGRGAAECMGAHSHGRRARRCSRARSAAHGRHAREPDRRERFRDPRSPTAPGHRDDGAVCELGRWCSPGCSAMPSVSGSPPAWVGKFAYPNLPQICRRSIRRNRQICLFPDLITIKPQICRLKWRRLRHFADSHD